MIEKGKTNVKIRLTIYKQKVPYYYNKRVYGRQFQDDDLVFRKVEAISHVSRKLDPNLERLSKVLTRTRSDT